jgi:outer membrane protein
MRKLVLLALLALPLSRVCAQELKLAIVDMQVVLQNAPQIAKLNDQLTKQFKPRQESILQAKKNLEAQVNNLEKNGAVLDDKEREKLKNRIITDRNSLQTTLTAYQNDFSQAQNKSLQTFSKQLDKAVTSVAQKDHLDLVLQKGGVLFAKSGLDITQEVLLALK